MAMIIAFVSQKGGVGKSTTARAIGREGVAAGLKTKIADLDTQQGTSVDWCRVRMDVGIEPIVPAEPVPTAAHAIALADSCDLLIIDGPARTSKATLEIARAASLVVQPTGASLDDLRPAIREFHALVKAGIPRERLVFALNRIGTEAEEQEARAYIADAGYRALDGCLLERPAYRQAQNEGRTVTETRHPTLNTKAEVLLQAIIDAVE